MIKLKRNSVPKPQNTPLFSLPKIEELRTTNSCKIFYVHKKNLPIVRFSYVLELGSRFDPKYKKGLANLFGMVLDEGADGLNALELKEKFQLLGTNFSLNTSKDSVSFSILSLKENFSKSLDLVSLILNKPNFSKKDFEREKNKVLTSHQQIKDSADYIADISFDTLVFINNSYAFPTIGVKDHITKLSLQDIKSYYKNIFKKAAPYLIVVGDIEKDNLVSIIQTKFAPIRQNNSIKKPAKILKGTKTQIYFVNKKGSVQSEIRIGHINNKRIEKAFYSKSILNTIFGGQFSSRLNLNLREKKGYTYGIHSGFDNYKDASVFNISTSVSSENTGNAIREIIVEMHKIQKGVTKNELSFAKSSISKRFPSNFETYGQIASNISSKIKYNLPDNYFNDYLKKINKVTLNELKNAAVNNIHPKKSLILVVGDKEKILPQLEKLKLGKITEVDIFGNKL